MAGKNRESFDSIVKKFNEQYTVDSEIVVETNEGELLVTAVKKEAELMHCTFPVIKTYHKDGYVWLGNIPEFADRYPKIKKAFE